MFKLSAWPKRRKILVAAALGGVVILAGAGAGAYVFLLGGAAPHAEVAEAPPAPPPAPVLPIGLPAKEGPRDQRAFLGAITAARIAMDQPGGGATPRLISNRIARGEALCAALTQGPPRRWVGTISQVGQNEDKRGTLTIDIAPGVSLRTWNTAATDVGFNTLLDPKEPFYIAAEMFGRGQQVVFSATFFPSPLDCVSLANLNPASALREPAFIVRFDELAPLGPVKALMAANEGKDGQKEGAKDPHKGDTTGSTKPKH